MSVSLPSAITQELIRPCKDDLQAAIRAFSPISLPDLKATAGLMDRRDNKYVLSTQDMLAFLEAATNDFDMLEIDGLRQFCYVSLYFDSDHFHTWQDHYKGRRRRIKIRYRHYVDSNKHYLEIKLKGLRKQTLKERVRILPDALLQDGQLHPNLQAFCQGILQKEGYKPWPHPFLPGVSVLYKRLTLVGKSRAERITIDNGIAFLDNFQATEAGTPHYLNDDRWVVEVKSTSGRTRTDLWLQQHGLRPVSLCSKYGMGVNLLKHPQINNGFSSTMRRYFGVDSRIARP